MTKDLRDKLASGEVSDAPQDNAVYEDTDSEAFADGEAQVVPSKKPKKKVEISDMLDDAGFLEF